MSTTDPTLNPIDADRTSDDSGTPKASTKQPMPKNPDYSDDEESMSEDSDDENTIPADEETDFDNSDRKQGKYSDSEDDEELNSNPITSPLFPMTSWRPCFRRRRNRLAPPPPVVRSRFPGAIQPRQESEITDFRAGFGGNVRQSKAELPPDDGEPVFEDEEKSYYGRRETYEGFMRLYFSEEQVKQREVGILKTLGDRPDWFDFPVDPEGWTEKDNWEVWCDRPVDALLPGFDPNWRHYSDYKQVGKSLKGGNKPTIGPFYVPYRKYNSAVTSVHPDARKPKQLIEELDMVEEFMRWSSCVFYDGSSYEGTVWDDVAQGKGVYISRYGLVRQ